MSRSREPANPAAAAIPWRSRRPASRAPRPPRRPAARPPPSRSAARSPISSPTSRGPATTTASSRLTPMAMSAPSTTSSGSICRSASSIAPARCSWVRRPGTRCGPASAGRARTRTMAIRSSSTTSRPISGCCPSSPCSRATEFHQCIAVSQTDDPTGAWYLYDFLISATKVNDYPHFGVWPDAYYMSINQFDGNTFEYAGAGAVAFERDKMLAGLPARTVYFDVDGGNQAFGGMLPSDWDSLDAASRRRTEPVRRTGRRRLRQCRHRSPEFLGVPRRLGRPRRIRPSGSTVCRASSRTPSRSTRTSVDSRPASRSRAPTRASTRSATG